MAKPTPMPLTNHLTGLPLNCQRCGRPFTAITQTKITDEGMVCRMGKACDKKVPLCRTIRGQFVDVVEDIYDKPTALKHPWYQSHWTVRSRLPRNETPCIIDKPFMGTVAKAREVVTEWDALVTASRQIATKGATPNEHQATPDKPLLRLVA